MAGMLAVLTMGVLLGAQHATDADHVVAVSTIVARERRVLGAARIGALWGVGHSATVLCAGGAMIASGVVLAERTALALEMLVALMLVVLGVAGVRRARAAMQSYARAAAAGPAPSPSGPFVPSSSKSESAWSRPVVIGMVHGLAGSAALALAVLATVRDRAVALGYLALFCGGTIVGMSVVTAALSTPIALASRRVRPLTLHRLALAAGAASIGFGVWLGYRVGIVDALLLGPARAAMP